MNSIGCVFFLFLQFDHGLAQPFPLEDAEHENVGTIT